MSTHRIRPVRKDDLKALIKFSGQQLEGIVTLPHDKTLLKEKIDSSMHAFSEKLLHHSAESYLFVMEEIPTEQVVGCCGILSKTGGFDPLPFFQLKQIKLSSPAIHVSHRIKMMELCWVHKGPSEVCTLFLLPEHRHSGLGRLLSLSRFLFMCQFPERFESSVMAEIRGFLTPQNHSPFWDYVCHPFFKLEFPTANRLRYEDHQFIAELMPKFPLYVDLLPKEIQKVLSQTHSASTPALQLLLEEGFKYSGYLDIFDAGPQLIAQTSQLRAVKEGKSATVASISKTKLEGEPWIVSNHSLDFYACLAPLEFVKRTEVIIDRVTAKALDLRVGDSLSYMSPHPKPKKRRKRDD